MDSLDNGVIVCKLAKVIESKCGLDVPQRGVGSHSPAPSSSPRIQNTSTDGVSKLSVTEQNERRCERRREKRRSSKKKMLVI